MDNSEAIKLKKRISKLKLKQQVINNSIFSLSAELQTICDHSDTKIEEDYKEGSYLNESEYITNEVCAVCGKLMATESISGGFV